MPRKKQGLRSYHHKSRNGCLQCKRRRVKCSMQSPACANCIRRHETCEYAGIIDGSSAIAHAHRHDCDTSKSSRHMITANSTCSPPHIRHSFPDMAFSNMSLIGTMLQAVMGRSWFTPTEAGVWSKAILGHVNEHPYLQHCIYSIAYLRRDLLDNPSDRCTSAVAYEHQMAASALFRQRTTPIQRDNWVPTLSFHVFTLVFEFGSQSVCAAEQYNLLDTLRVLRTSHAIEEEAKPYFRASRFWQMVSMRDRARKYEVDPALRTNLLALGGVVAELTSSQAHNAALNLQALTELKHWVTLCDGHPRRWDQYCHWPGHLDPMFLQLLDEGDDVAFLLTIHWAAMLYRSPKPAVYRWARRTASFAIAQLKERERWDNLLVWPIQVLCRSKDLELSMINMSEHAKILEVDRQLRALSMTDSGTQEAENLGDSIEGTFGERMTLEPPPSTTGLASSDSSRSSPAPVLSEDDFSTYDLSLATGNNASPYTVPYTGFLTQPDMLIDPMLLPVREPESDYLADWETQFPATSVRIELNGVPEFPEPNIIV